VHAHAGATSLRASVCVRASRVCRLLRGVQPGHGRPISVLEVITAFRAASGQAIPYEGQTAAPGDAPSSFAEPTKARSVLGWEAALTLPDMCADASRWVSKNPMGYAAQ